MIQWCNRCLLRLNLLQSRRPLRRGLHRRRQQAPSQSHPRALETLSTPRPSLQALVCDRQWRESSQPSLVMISFGPLLTYYKRQHTITTTIKRIMTWGSFFLITSFQARRFFTPAAGGTRRQATKHGYPAWLPSISDP